MAYTTIDDPSAHFQVKLYTGTGASHSVTFDGNSNMQPDFVWNKRRNASYYHRLWDSNRGVTKYVPSNDSTAEATFGYVSSFDSNGITFGSSDQSVNASGQPYVLWNWKCNGGTTSSNTTGSITSTVQANSDAGFNIVTYTGNGSNSNFGHGMSEQPDMVIVRRRNSAANWCVWHKNLTSSYYMQLDTTISQQTGPWDGLDPSSGVVYVYSGGLVNGNGDDYLAYIFKGKKGYSKFGVYTSSNLGDVANGRVRGKYVHTGFKPAFVMIKCISTSANWQIYHHKIPTYGNEIDLKLGANRSEAENGSDLGNTSQNNLDFYANGFRCTTRNTDTNTGSNKYIYMAFAENPFVTSTGIPTTAR